MSSDYFKSIVTLITSFGFTITSKDDQRPWGGFLVIEEQQAQEFSNQFFKGIEVDTLKIGANRETKMKVYNEGDQITLINGERHRLIGLDDYAVVAEIWQHTDANHPSDEDDIIRVQDDFGR